MDLLFDIGNTNVSFALASRGKLSHFDRLGITDVSLLVRLRSTLIDMRKKNRISRVALCSVNPKARDSLIRTIMKLLSVDIYVCGENLPVGVPSALRQPQRTGHDRLLSCRAAWELHKTACIVVDMGTAVTVDLIDETGTFRGGAIVPGISTSAAVLEGTTALLPAIVPTEVDSALGTDTESAIAGGLYFGYLGMIRELITRIRDEYGKPVDNIIATGGDANFLAPGVGLFTQTVPDLTLQGLARCLASYKKEKPSGRRSKK